MDKEYSNILKKVNVPKCIKEFGEKMTYRKGDIVVYPGEYLDGIYFIDKGRVAYLTYSLEGQEKIFFIVEPGCVVAVNAISNKPLNVFVKALEDVEVLLIRKETFTNLLQTDYAFTLYVIDSLCDKLFGLSRQMEEGTFYDAETRVCNIFIELAQCYGKKENNIIKLDFCINQQFISNIIGTNRVTTARILRKLKDLNLIEISEGQYIIKDLIRLKAYTKKNN